MKIGLIYFISFAFLAALSFMVFAQNEQGSTRKGDDWSKLKLVINTPQQVYLLGEPVRLNFKLVNEGSRKTISPPCASIEDGYMGIHVSLAGGPFKRQYGSRSRFQVDGCLEPPHALEPGESFSDVATVLWNVKPEVAGLSDFASKQLAKERIMSDYAFPEAGLYSIKTVLYLPGQGGKTLQSEPIQVILTEPVGEDLVVWDQIKNSREFAYFLQYGEFLTLKPAEQKAVLKNLEDIVAAHPNSVYSIRIRQSLEKLRAEKKFR